MLPLPGQTGTKNARIHNCQAPGMENRSGWKDKPRKWKTCDKQLKSLIVGKLHFMCKNIAAYAQSDNHKRNIYLLKIDCSS